MPGMYDTVRRNKLLRPHQKQGKYNSKLSKMTACQHYVSITDFLANSPAPS
jgi:hypothetical protein